MHIVCVAWVHYDCCIPLYMYTINCLFSPMDGHLSCFRLMSCGNSVFKLLRNHLNVFRHGCIILHSHHQWMRVLTSLYPCQHLLFSAFLMVVLLVGWKWYLFVGLICISLMILNIFSHAYWQGLLTPFSQWRNQTSERLSDSFHAMQSKTPFFFSSNAFLLSLWKAASSHQVSIKVSHGSWEPALVSPCAFRFAWVGFCCCHQTPNILLGLLASPYSICPLSKVFFKTFLQRGSWLYLNWNY